MQGLGGYARLSKESGHMLWEVSTNFRTPAYNNNDIAFFSKADYWWMSANIFPLWTKPTKWYRQLYVIAGGQQRRLDSLRGFCDWRLYPSLAH